MSRDLAAIAAAAARAGAAALQARFRDRGLAIEAKAEHDLVSAADRESEEAIAEFLHRHLPDHGILTEEAGRLGPANAEHEWIVDPLDGTNNFLQGLPIWAVSIACRRGEELLAGVILEPLEDNCFTAGRGDGAWWNGERMRVSERATVGGAFLATGYPFHARGAIDAYLRAFKRVFLEARSIRRCGAAALDLAHTAAGIYDGFFEFRLSPWDVAAGALLVEEAGGRITDLGGGSGYLARGNVVAAGEAVHGELLALLQAEVSEELLDSLAPLD